ncbi:hypothetical protein BHM03_00017684, partial [Ensete ventricosum]
CGTPLITNVHLDLDGDINNQSHQTPDRITSSAFNPNPTRVTAHGGGVCGCVPDRFESLAKGFAGDELKRIAPRERRKSTIRTEESRHGGRSRRQWSAGLSISTCLSPCSCSLCELIGSLLSLVVSFRSGSRWDDLGRKILEAFIPEGVSTYIRSMLSTQALLSAIGVGEKSATVIGATFQVLFSKLDSLVFDSTSSTKLFL